MAGAHPPRDRPPGRYPRLPHRLRRGERLVEPPWSASGSTGLLAVRCGWPLAMSSPALAWPRIERGGEIAGGDRDLGDHVEGVDDLHAGARVMPGQALKQFDPLGVDLMGLAQPPASVECRRRRRRARR